MVMNLIYLFKLNLRLSFSWTFKINAYIEYAGGVLSTYISRRAQGITRSVEWYWPQAPLVKLEVQNQAKYSRLWHARDYTCESAGQSFCEVWRRRYGVPAERLVHWAKKGIWVFDCMTKKCVFLITVNLILITTLMMSMLTFLPSCSMCRRPLNGWSICEWPPPLYGIQKLCQI
jgi:hypothetical protein